MKIKFLEAINGDSILISYIEGTRHRNILIDGGMRATYSRKNKNNKIEFGDLKHVIDNLREKNEIIDLLVLTHVDDDHIGGILKWFEQDKDAYSLVGKVWFNSGRLICEYFKSEEIEENLLSLNLSGSTDTSIGQGIKFEDYLEKHNIWDRRIIKDCEEFDYLGLTFKILSPNLVKLNVLLKKWEKEYPGSTDTTGEENDYNATLIMHSEAKY